MDSNQDNFPLNPKDGQIDNKTDSATKSTAPKSQMKVVTVKIFDRLCSFKSNRPELVEEIASLADEEISLIKAQFPGIKHEMDLAAHAAFGLARRLLKILRENRDLHLSLEEAEQKVEQMTVKIESALEKD
jgi:hypothetical protein